MTKKALPKGVQDFSTIRELKSNFIYVDKTKEIIDMIKMGKSSFISRPRRFGKSLTISTIEALFEGKKELFKGLYAENNWNWTETYPVVKFDFSNATSLDVNGFKEYITDEIEDNLRRFDIKGEEFKSAHVPTCFKNALRVLNEKTNKKIVFLVDEYDFPLVHLLNDIEKAKAFREILAGLYGTLKKCSRVLQYVLISGVSKFTKLSLFSTANHLQDLTIHKKIPTICGYTHKEVLDNFKDYLEGIDLKEMKRWYNGYNYLGEPLYNPYDILFLFDYKEFKNYWWETGTSTLLMNQLQKESFYISDFESEFYEESLLNSFDIENINPVALFWQSGYLTFDKVVKGKDSSVKYKMKYPNYEVKKSFNNLFLQTLTNKKIFDIESNNLIEALSSHKAENIKESLNSFFDNLPYNSYTKNDIAKYEGYYVNVLYALFYFLVGYKAYTEIATSRGRIDLSLEGEKEIFVIEIKTKDSKKSPLEQIKEKKYYTKYLNSKKDIYLLGITFSKDSRSISELEIEKI